MIGSTDPASCSAAAVAAVSDLSDKVGAVGVAVILLGALWIMVPRNKDK
jgi:hypothetical protein